VDRAGQIDPGLALGHGHWLRWTDATCSTAIIRHHLAPTDRQRSCLEHGFCETAVTISSPAARSLWQLAAFHPLTITPSFQCHCGDSGWVTAGRWQPA
jgi:hypothetical protein